MPPEGVGQRLWRRQLFQEPRTQLLPKRRKIRVVYSVFSNSFLVEASPWDCMTTIILSIWLKETGGLSLSSAPMDGVYEDMR